MEECGFKEVYYNTYCVTCKYRYTREEDDPCDECLSFPARQYSHKPVKYEKTSQPSQTT